MFSGMSSLKDINPLENWNVSKGYNFKGMFSNCINISSLKPLENWNISKNSNIDFMFKGLLKEQKKLEK